VGVNGSQPPKKMANKHRIRPEADIDLDSIWSFIAADNTKAADAVIDRIADAFDLLLEMPLAGRARPELETIFAA
jgi:toxin ParE1/3/4